MKTSVGELDIPILLMLWLVVRPIFAEYNQPDGGESRSDAPCSVVVGRETIRSTQTNKLSPSTVGFHTILHSIAYPFY